jgi:flagellar export protein FliJ
LKKQREGVADQIEKRRQALVEADREVRVLEKLREQKETEYRQQDDAQEVKRLDEIASLQSFRAGLLERKRRV